MLGLCIHYESRSLRREHWSWVVDWFAVDKVWEINRPDGEESNTRFLPPVIDSVEQTPDVPLIVAAPKDGRYVQGEIHIDEFQHPTDAIYYFGHDHQQLNAIARPHQLVFIPSAKHEFYSAFAATIFLHERRRQHANT